MEWQGGRVYLHVGAWADLHGMTLVLLASVAIALLGAGLAAGSMPDRTGQPVRSRREEAERA